MPASGRSVSQLGGMECTRCHGCHREGPQLTPGSGRQAEEPSPSPSALQSCLSAPAQAAHVDGEFGNGISRCFPTARSPSSFSPPTGYHFAKHKSIIAVPFRLLLRKIKMRSDSRPRMSLECQDDGKMEVVCALMHRLCGQQLRALTSDLSFPVFKMIMKQIKNN